MTAAGVFQDFTASQPLLQPIDTPLLFSGFTSSTLEQFGPIFKQLGVTPVQGGASAALKGATPTGDWKNSLQPGDPIAGVLVSGDMSMTALGTTTYNDGKRVLGFGHQFLNLGPVNIPMATGMFSWYLDRLISPPSWRMRPGGRCAETGPAQRHNGGARDDLANDPRLAESAHL